MKKIFLVLIYCVFFAVAYAQTVDVPTDVQREFSLKVSGAQNVSWSVEAGTLYKASYRDSRGRDAVSFYDNFGKWLYSDIKISETDIPRAASQVINSQYSGFTIQSAIKNELPNNISRYVVQVQRGQETRGLVFDPAGKFIGIEMPSLTQR